MCGIAGVLQHPADGNVEAMIKTLAHRGPDGHGVHNLESGTLGHTRLAILDIEGGVQPMELKGSWIVFNGEIYNYRELQRRHLSKESAKTHSDTEIILRLYRKFGPSFVKMLDGMFAFVIQNRDGYLIARDPLGIKPLYYGFNADESRQYFASEIKALTKYVAEIHEFPAGHWFHSKQGWKRFYQLEGALEPFREDPEAALPLVRSTLREAVHKRLLADVPVGVSLSGGLDSSIVSALACEGTDQLHSFAVGVEGSRDLAAARKMSNVLNTKHHELVYTEEQMLEALPDVLYHLETFDPALVRSAIPNYFLAKLASQYVKVFLTGEGADEVYAGYEYLGGYDSPELLQKEMIHITEALHNTNLQRADRMSMAFSLEARVPFLDVNAVALAMSFPAEWKLHQNRVPKELLRKAFADMLPEEIANRPKQKFSKGAGSSDLIAQRAESEIPASEFESEAKRLKRDWEFSLENKEALFYYKILRDHYEDKWLFPTMGTSRSL